MVTNFAGTGNLNFRIRSTVRKEQSGGHRNSHYHPQAAGILVESQGLVQAHVLLYQPITMVNLMMEELTTITGGRYTSRAPDFGVSQMAVNADLAVLDVKRLSARHEREGKARSEALRGILDYDDQVNAQNRAMEEKRMRVRWP